MRTVRPRKSPSKATGAPRSGPRPQKPAPPAEISIRAATRDLADRLFDASRADTTDELSKAAAVILDALELAIRRGDAPGLGPMLRLASAYASTRTTAERWTNRGLPPTANVDRADAVRHLQSIAALAVKVRRDDQSAHVAAVALMVSTSTADVLMTRTSEAEARAKLSAKLHKRLQTRRVLDPSVVVLDALMAHGVKDAHGWLKVADVT